MQDQFQFKLNTETYYGFGFCRQLRNFLNKLGFQDIVILVHEGVEKHSEYYQEILGTLEAEIPNLNVIVLRGSEEPDYDYLDEVAADVRALPKLDAIIGLGGGSCLDITKAVALLRTNPGKGVEYRGFDKGKVPGVPVIAIPTTAGTGSEVTINAVFTNRQEMKKLGINGRYMDAAFAILDAEWTLSCPFEASLSSGLDALVHSLESFMCKQANPLTRMYSREAFRLMYENLPCLVDNPKDKQGRQKLLLGSYLAAIGLFNSGSGVAGALSYPLGVHYHVPHGLAGGIFILDVLEFNIDQGYYDYAELNDLIEPGLNLSEEQKSRQLLDNLNQLYDRLGVGLYLDQWGVSKENVSSVAKLMEPLQGAFDQNPISCSVNKDALSLLKKHVKP
jgi:alcohol dehydrogenase